MPARNSPNRNPGKRHSTREILKRTRSQSRSATNLTVAAGADVTNLTAVRSQLFETDQRPSNNVGMNICSIQDLQRSTHFLDNAESRPISPLDPQVIANNAAEAVEAALEESHFVMGSRNLNDDDHLPLAFVANKTQVEAPVPRHEKSIQTLLDSRLIDLLLQLQHTDINQELFPESDTIRGSHPQGPFDVQHQKLICLGKVVSNFNQVHSPRPAPANILPPKVNLDPTVHDDDTNSISSEITPGASSRLRVRAIIPPSPPISLLFPKQKNSREGKSLSTHCNVSIGTREKESTTHDAFRYLNLIPLLRFPSNPCHSSRELTIIANPAELASVAQQVVPVKVDINATAGPNSIPIGTVTSVTRTSTCGSEHHNNDQDSDLKTENEGDKHDDNATPAGPPPATPANNADFLAAQLCNPSRFTIRIQPLNCSSSVAGADIARSNITMGYSDFSDSDSTCSSDYDDEDYCGSSSSSGYSADDEESSSSSCRSDEHEDDHQTDSYSTVDNRTANYAASQQVQEVRRSQGDSLSIHEASSSGPPRTPQSQSQPQTNESPAAFVNPENPDADGSPLGATTDSTTATQRMSRSTIRTNTDRKDNLETT